MKKTLIVEPIVYMEEPRDYRLKAEEAGESGIYDEMAVMVERISDGKCVADVYFTVDRESGEPCILITSEGEGMGDYAIRVFPMRPREKMVEEEK